MDPPTLFFLLEWPNKWDFCLCYCWLWCPSWSDCYSLHLPACMLAGSEAACSTSVGKWILCVSLDNRGEIWGFVYVLEMQWQFLECTVSASTNISRWCLLSPPASILNAMEFWHDMPLKISWLIRHRPAHLLTKSDHWCWHHGILCPWPCFSSS